MSSGYQTALSSTWLDVPGDLNLSGLDTRNWHRHLRPPRHLFSARGSWAAEITQPWRGRSEQKATILAQPYLA